MNGWQGSDDLNYFGVAHRLSEMPDHLREHSELVLTNLGPGVYHFELDGVQLELTVTVESDDFLFKLTSVKVADDPPDAVLRNKISGLWARLTGRHPRPDH